MDTNGIALQMIIHHLIGTQDNEQLTDLYKSSNECKSLLNLPEMLGLLKNSFNTPTVGSFLELTDLLKIRQVSVWAKDVVEEAFPDNELASFFLSLCANRISQS